MATHIVTPNQNIWDVALLLYGTIEGVFDLLISNNWLTMTTDLTTGMELEYHDYFVISRSIVDEIHAKNYNPANGERTVYYKYTDEPMIFMIGIPESNAATSFVVSGDGEMVIDWGDNTQLETIALNHTEQLVEHYFDNVVDSRIIRIYGNFQLVTWDISKVGGSILAMQPVVVDELVSNSNSNSLDALFLFKDTVKLDLRGMQIPSLVPIYNMSLQELNLSNVGFPDVSVIDDYLHYIATNYGSRRNCTVYLDIEPTDIGMSAINTILTEPSWNEVGAWKFIINDQIYTVE